MIEQVYDHGLARLFPDGPLGPLAPSLSAALGDAVWTIDRSELDA